VKDIMKLATFHERFDTLLNRRCNTQHYQKKNEQHPTLPKKMNYLTGRSNSSWKNETFELTKHEALSFL